MAEVDPNRVGRIETRSAAVSTAVLRCAIVSVAAQQGDRPRSFRTIQVCPKDLPAFLRQVEPAVDRPAGRSPMSDMRRRQFIALLGGASAWPLAARAQQTSVPVIGFLGPGSAQSDAYRVTAFRQGLSQAGLVDGQNFTLDYRWADSHYDRLPALATELVRRQVAVIATSGTPAALAAKAATKNIPIVFETAGDPVQLGLVASLSRPGGNITGVTQASEEMAPKRLELLHELLPKAGVLALLVNPTAPELAEPQKRGVVSAARALSIDLQVLNASTQQDFERVFAKLSELRAGGLVIGGGTRSSPAIPNSSPRSRFNTRSPQSTNGASSLRPEV